MSANGHRAPTPAEIAWARHIAARDDAGLRVLDVELELLREIVARSKAAEQERGHKS